MKLKAKLLRRLDSSTMPMAIAAINNGLNPVQDNAKPMTQEEVTDAIKQLTRQDS